MKAFTYIDQNLHHKKQNVYYTNQNAITKGVQWHGVTCSLLVASVGITKCFRFILCCLGRNCEVPYDASGGSTKFFSIVYCLHVARWKSRRYINIENNYLQPRAITHVEPLCCLGGNREVLSKYVQPGVLRITKGYQLLIHTLIVLNVDISS